MCRHLPILFAFALLFGCGGGSLDVDGTESVADAGGQEPDSSVDDGGVFTPPPITETDAGTPGSDAGEPADMGEMADMPAPYMPPTMNVPQSGPSVGTQVSESCSTSSVKGLSTQLIEQMNCLDPGIMKSFAGAPDISYGGSVFPFMQGPATDAFVTTSVNYAGTIPVNSATRTIPQQYLLYRWYQLGLCNANLAASPGRSNHNGGLAVDIGSSGTWASRMRANSFIDNVSGEPWHFYFNGAGGKDVRNLSVLAFQQLYNLNFPENPIDEDGLYGPQTEGALRSSPANGFAEPPYCPSTRSLEAFPWAIPMETQAEAAGEFWQVRTIVPSGVTEVEYWVDGQLQRVVSRAEHPHFETFLEGFGSFEVVARAPEANLQQIGAGYLAADGFFILPFDSGLVRAGWSAEDSVVISVNDL